MTKRRRQTGHRRAPSRRWHIPPPLIHGPETLEGGGILQEWSEELGVRLWQAARDTLLWATSDPASRGELFAPDACFDPASIADALEDRQREATLAPAFATLARMLAKPTRTRDEHVARACRDLSHWAEEQGRLVTALSFAQSAALATPGDPAAAFWVATLAVRLNDHARAEVWFRRAIGLARRSRNWRMYSRAFGGLGNLYIRRGNLPAARRLHTRALRGARRGGMRREQAAALHDLFAVAVETDNVIEAERLARQALDAYGTRNRRVHVLAHDVAYFWMEQGHFARALPVFQAVLPLIERPVERLFVLADTARAAGGVGDVETASAAAEEVWSLTPELRCGAARALLEVARGFVSLGQLDRAEEAARSALAFATEFRESKIHFAAESLLSSIPDLAAPPTRVEPLATPPTHDRTGDQLAADFVRTLEVIAGASS